MFSLERGMRYWLYSEPTDMRKSFHTLSGLVRNKIGGDPMNGDVYVFVNKRRNRIKLLHYETGGMVIYAKMLDRGTFGMPIPGSKDVVTSSIKWEDLLKMVEGIMASEQEIIAAQAAEIERLKNKVASLEDQLCWLRKKMFGKMSEKNLPLDPSVLSEPTLFDEPLTDEERAELDAAVKKDEEDAARLIQVRGFERKPRKVIDTAHLEVREEHIYPEVENREDYTELDPEVTDTLVLIPAQIYVRRIIRHKLVLKSNLQIKDPERNAFELAPLPVMPLPKCMASESLLTDIILQKFLYHMPFYRVIQKYKELGVKISDGGTFPRDCAKAPSRLLRNNPDGWLWRLRPVRE